MVLQSYLCLVSEFGKEKKISLQTGLLLDLENLEWPRIWKGDLENLEFAWFLGKWPGMTSKNIFFFSHIFSDSPKFQNHYSYTTLHALHYK